MRHRFRPARATQAVAALVLAAVTAIAAAASPGAARAQAAAQSPAAAWTAGQAGPATRVMTMPAPAAGSPAPRSPRVPTATEDWTLRPLPFGPTGMEITGETGSLDMAVWLTEGQAAATRAVQVAYRAAVSVRPEGSSLTLLVNGTVAGRTRIFAPAGLETVRFHLPDGLLAPGFNRITLAAEMRHRVDCSVPATFELWTRFEPAATGLLLVGTPQGPASLADLRALPAATDGSLPLRVVLPGKLRPAGVGAVLQLVQAVALALGDRPLAVDFGAPSGGAQGANLVLGTADDLAASGVATQGLVPGRPALLAATAERRATLALLAESHDDLAHAIAELGQAAAARTPRPWPGAGRLLAGDERVSLRDLGMASRDFGGRVFRTGFDVTLPADLLPADYASIVLAVDGAIAPGLAGEAQLRVEVNGRHVAAAPLPRAGAQTLRVLPIHLPLGVFRPGRNRIALVASLPTAEDAACSPAGVGAEAPRFLLLDTTALLVPSLARAVRVPELSQLAGGGLPFRKGQEAWLVTPAPDRDSMGAAATLVARLAQAAGGVIPFRFQSTLPAPDGLDRLVVAGQGVLDPALSPAFGPVRWSASVPSVLAAETRPAAGAASQRPGASSATAPALPDWAARWPGAVPKEEHSATEAIARTLREAGERVSRTLDGWIADWFRRGGDAVPAEASLVVAEAEGTGGITQVLVVGASPEALRAGVTRLVRPDLWPSLAGAETRLAGETVSVVRHAQHFSLGPGALTPGNVRLVLAGWLSLNPATYGGGAILLALVLAVTTGLVLRHVGRASS